MNALDGILDDLNKADLDFVENGLLPVRRAEQSLANYLARINRALEAYQKDGTETDISYIENWEDAKDDHLKPPTEIVLPRNSLKENIKPKDTPVQETETSPPRSRSKRNAFKEASQNIGEQVNLPLNTKLRRPRGTTDKVCVKLEKLSICTEEKSTLDSSQVQNVKEEVTIKKEVDEMPAPSRPAPRRKKRKGESKIQVKEEKIEPEDAKSRESDVIIQDTTVTVVSLIDSPEEKKESLGKKKGAKPRTKKAKRTRTYSSEDDAKASDQKRSKSLEDEQEDETVQKFEDALSTLDANEVNNATFVAVAKKSQQNMNATVVVDNPKFTTNMVPTSVDDMMTDDESDKEVENKNPPKPARAIPKPIKQVFSPFDQSPVKKKVQAFEKLREEANAIPQRVTRTKTRAQAKEQTEVDGAEEPKSNVKEKAKMFTPTTSRFIPKAASTTIKSRVAPSASNESLLSTKSGSALKASQAEFREREKKRKEKEQEAIKKREALIQAQIEEKKRKREEKQLKAQQQREALEKEKLKALEVQRLKDERHKQLMAEQEEKKQKQKEEAEKKRLMAKMRAIEEKKREEEKRIEEQKKADEMAVKLAKQDGEIAQMLKKQKQKQVPIYLRTRAPYLPTPDCYDSDEDERNESIVLPDWAKERNLRFMQKCAFAAGEAIKNTFFSLQAQTPDLQDIFEVIEPQKLQRSSSAVWHKPPRFTMVPPELAVHDETDDFDED